MSNINVLSQVLKFAIPHLTMGIVEALCKHRTKVCKITERMVDMTYKFYRQICNMTARCANSIGSSSGLKT